MRTKMTGCSLSQCSCYYSWGLWLATTATLSETSFTPPPFLSPLPCKYRSSIFESPVSYSHAHPNWIGGRSLFGGFCFAVFVVWEHDTQLYRNFKTFKCLNLIIKVHFFIFQYIFVCRSCQARCVEVHFLQKKY